MSLIGPGFKCCVCGGDNPLTEVKIFGYNLRQILQMEKYWIAHNSNRPDGEEPPLEILSGFVYGWKNDK